MQVRRNQKRKGLKRKASRGHARQSTIVTMRRKKFVVNKGKCEEIDSRNASETGYSHCLLHNGTIVNTSRRAL